MSQYRQDMAATVDFLLRFAFEAGVVCTMALFVWICYCVVTH